MVVTPFDPKKLLWHSDRIKAMQEGATIYPISVEFDLSNRCNHGCAWCSFGTDESQGYRQQNWVIFPTERTLTLLGELAGLGVKSVTFTGGGEPLVHPHAATIFDAAADLGLEYGVVTNGVNLRGRVLESIAKHAKFVRVSLDAGSSDTHQITHRARKPEYHQILDNIRHLREKAGTRITIGASFCAMDVNWREIYAAGRDVKEHGGNYLEVRPTFPTDWRGDGLGMALTDDNVENAKVELAHAKNHLDGDGFTVIGMIDRFDKLAEPTKDYERCQIGPLMTVIGATGDVFHCCVQRGMPGFTIGNVLKASFKDVWMTDFHRKLVGDIDVQKCPRCRYDGFNRILDSLTRDEMHVNFV